MPTTAEMSAIAGIISSAMFFGGNMVVSYITVPALLMQPSKPETSSLVSPLVSRENLRLTRSTAC
jgi:hypothetical protein